MVKNKNFSHSILLLIFLCFHLENTIGNNYSEDNKAVKDSILWLLDQSDHNKHINHSLAIDYALRAKQLSRNIRLEDTEAKSNFMICSLFNGKMKYDSILYHCDKAERYYEKSNNVDSLAWLNDFKGVIKDRMGEPVLAEQHFLKGVEMFRSTGNRIGEATALSDLGVLHNFLGNYSISLTKYYEALKIFEEENFEEGQIRTLLSLGFYYKKQEQYEQSLEHFEKSLEMASRLKFLDWELTIIRGMIRVLEKVGEEEKAIEYLQKAIETSRLTKNNYEHSQALFNLSRIKYNAGRLEESEAYLKEALEIDNQHSFGKSRLSMMRLLIKIKFAQNDMVGAKKYLIECEKISQETNNKDAIAHIFNHWSTYYEKQGDWHKALEYKKKHLQLYQQIAKNEKTEAITKIQDSYALSTKVELLQERAKAKENNLKNQRKLNIALIGLFVLGILLSVVLYYLYFIKKNENFVLEKEITQRTKDLVQTNEQLKKSNLELNRFAYITSHDLKEPVRNIVSFLQLAERKLKKEDYGEVKNFIQISKKSALQLHYLIEDILEYSKSGEVPQHVSSDVGAVLDDIKQSLKQTLSDKNAEILTGQLPQVNALEGDVRRLFLNLINNGIKFNKSNNPTVNVSCEQRGEMAIFKVKDNGIGIDKQYHDKIFQMFTRLHNRKDFEGTGLGLAIVKKLVEKYGGEITIDSQIGKGTTFIFTIPTFEPNKVLEH